MSILVTGGCGYIGSHTVLELLNNQYDLIVLDNLSNSSFEPLRRIELLSGKQITFCKGDILDEECLESIFANNKIDAVIHFAGLKSVSESKDKPLDYYTTNVAGTLSLLSVMKKFNIKKMIFSSSATVYGNPSYIPIDEKADIGGTTNPYGTSKLIIEKILQDYIIASPEMSLIILRYFNPIGAHSSGIIGEDPKGLPNNLLPYITQIAVGKLSTLSIFGGDYNTPDGTGIRDYIHVVDLAKGHIKALNKTKQNNGLFIYNLGTGIGYSVLDVVNIFQKVTGKIIKYDIKDRRVGDIAECWSNPKLANEELEWFADYSLEDMIRDAWNWQRNNPDGYKKKNSN